jgi:hypothetical protein
MKKINYLGSSPVDGLSRRKFIRRTSLAVGAAFSFPYVGNVLGANDRINLACIGCGGKGDSDTNAAKSCGGNIVALCDVDENTLNKKTRQFKDSFPDLKQFRVTANCSTKWARTSTRSPFPFPTIITAWRRSGP